MWNRKKEDKKEKEPEYEVCSECKHLIKAGSGQRVKYYYHDIWRYDDECVFCSLHTKPYDRVMVPLDGNRIYEKRIEPWKRVNADGTDYKKKA